METVSLPLSTALSIRDTLNACYHLLLTEDTAEAYRKCNSQVRSSPLTLSVQQAHEALVNYLLVNENDEPAE